MLLIRQTDSSSFSSFSFSISALNFFSQDEQYEIIYIGEEQEALINHVMESIPSHGSKRLIVLESESQAAKITIDDVAAYCLVNESGAVSYYMRK